MNPKELKQAVKGPRFARPPARSTGALCAASATRRDQGKSRTEIA